MQVLTTRGWVPAEQVRLVATVEETDAYTMTRTDKFIGDEWVGNDLHLQIKHGADSGIQQGGLGG